MLDGRSTCWLGSCSDNDVWVCVLNGYFLLFFIVYVQVSICLCLELVVLVCTSCSFEVKLNIHGVREWETLDLEVFWLQVC